MDRGQAYTLEGTIGAILIVTAVVFGMQAVDSGPWAGDPDRGSDRLSTQAEDFLAVTAANGSLQEAVRCYSPSKPVFNGGAIGDDSAWFEEQLNHTFDRQGLEYNIYVSYWDDDDGRETEAISSVSDDALAAPDEDAGSATHRFALYDDDRVSIQDGRDCAGTGPRIGDLDSFYIPDANEDSELYNVVEVRVVVW